MSIALGMSDCGVAMGVERMGRGLGAGGRKAESHHAADDAGRRAERRPAGTGSGSRRLFLGRFSRLHPGLALAPIHGADGPETWPRSTSWPARRWIASRSRATPRPIGPTRAGSTRDEIVPLEVELPVFDDEKNWVEEERGEKVLFDRDECIREGTTTEKLAKLNPDPGNGQLRRPRDRNYTGQRLPDQRRSLGGARDGRGQGARARPHAPRPDPGHGSRWGQASADGSRSRRLLQEGPCARRESRRARSTGSSSTKAFSAQVLASLKELEIPEERVNVNGGSLALGHPLGATGARLVSTVAHELRRSGGRYGLATQCIGAGMGISTVIERLD